VLATLNTILRDHNISAQVRPASSSFFHSSRAPRLSCRCLTLPQVCGTNDHVGYFMCNGASTCPRPPALLTRVAVDTDKAVEVRDAIAVCKFSRRTRIIHPK
jgi:hypothetical protein